MHVLYEGAFGNTPSICGTSPKQRQASQAMRLEKALPTAPGEDAHREQHDTWDMPPAMGVHPGVPCRAGEGFHAREGWQGGASHRREAPLWNRTE